ncbi:hypothetical protein [Sorangium sp. So ce381]|uniref:hypothetical protein n=1 Tax=Sorangium sp. So ce381 TaxID=3133307 RepID=UPI003F5CA3B9
MTVIGHPRQLTLTQRLAKEYEEKMAWERKPYEFLLNTLDQVQKLLGISWEYAELGEAHASWRTVGNKGDFRIGDDGSVACAISLTIPTKNRFLSILLPVTLKSVAPPQDMSTHPSFKVYEVAIGLAVAQLNADGSTSVLELANELSAQLFDEIDKRCMPEPAVSSGT